jgi:hypothetical protein
MGRGTSTGLFPSYFWKKIEAARPHELFTEELAERLHTIRKIRNEFAHNLAPLNFNSLSIVELCKKLFSIEKIRTLRAAAVETFQESHEMVKAIERFVAPMVELPDTPRNTCMNAVKFLLLYLELFKTSTIMGDNDFIEIVTENILTGRDLRGQ